MAISESNRVRRFSLPDLADERVDLAITAFLEGPDKRRGRPRGGAVHQSPADPLAALQNRLAWNEALRRESARILRYHRPAAVIVVAGEPRGNTAEANGWLDRVAGPIAHALQRGIRQTDLVTRTASARFQVLLPETTGPEAAHIADRVVADCDVWLNVIRAPIALRVAVAEATPDMTLEAALDRALAALETR
jgi:PleD family two-component response regulator